MTKKRTLLWLIPLIVLILLIPFLVPSALPYAGAEELPVFSSVELANPSPEPVVLEPNPKYKNSMVSRYAPHKDAFTSEPLGYQDGTICVKIEKRTVVNGNGGKTAVYFTWVKIADPSQLRTSTNQPYPSKQLVAATSLARRERSVLAINGDYFCDRTEGIVYRNGELLRNSVFNTGYGYDALIIDLNGNFHILLKPDPSDFEPYEGCIAHSFIFGPALVVDGKMQVLDGNNYASSPGMGLHKYLQRQAICQMDNLTYLMITAEGPEQSKDGGLTGQEMAQLAYDCGAVQAYNLDGGSSSWLVLGTDRINATRGKKRDIQDIIYFVTAEAEPVPAE